jgi:hypothetical protein
MKLIVSIDLPAKVINFSGSDHRACDDGPRRFSECHRSGRLSGRHLSGDADGPTQLSFSNFNGRRDFLGAIQAAHMRYGQIEQLGHLLDADDPVLVQAIRQLCVQVYLLAAHIAA